MRVLTEALCSSAEHFLAGAIELELDHFLARFSRERSPDGLQAVVRNGYQPERCLLTGLGPVSVRVPKIRTRWGKSLAFHSMLAPAYLRRVRLRDLRPAPVSQYLSGVVGRDFGEALVALVGLHSMHLPRTLGRELNALWSGLWDHRFGRPLAGESWTQIRVDRIPLSFGDDEKNACVLVAIGVKGVRGNQLLATRECLGNAGESWGEVLLDLKARGATLPPEASIGRSTDGVARVCARVCDAVVPGTEVLDSTVGAAYPPHCSTCRIVLRTVPYIDGDHTIRLVK